MAVASEIEKNHKVKTKTVSIDFTSDDKQYVARFESEIRGLEIGVLVRGDPVLASLSFVLPSLFSRSTTSA